MLEIFKRIYHYDLFVLQQEPEKQSPQPKPQSENKEEGEAEPWPTVKEEQYSPPHDNGPEVVGRYLAC